MNDEKTHVFRHRIGNIFGIAVCIILLPILIVNITLIIKSYLNSDEVPSVGGYLPLIVLSDSMNPLIESGDLIICHTEEAEDVAKGDIIAFIDPAGDGTSVVSHRVTAVIDEDGALSFRTQGDVLGIYQRNIPGAGDVAMFLQTTNGLIVCVVIPLVLLVGYDLIRRRLYEKNQKSDKDALLQELEQLRAEKEAAGGDDADVIPESGVAMEATISPEENGSSSEEPVSPSFVPRRRTE
jgi:signal peptidase